MSSRMAGQTINDRFLAAKHSLAGQGLAKSVCKATTEELIGPKKKHLDYLVHCTNEPNVSIPQLANLLIERSQNTNWVVVYKALITVHHMMCYGNERFTQYLASSNSTFQLSNFFDKSGVQGYDMSPFIRKYARYLNEKALSYRTVAFDFCKVKRGKEDGALRTMNPDKLLKTLPTLQSQLDALLEFDCSANDLTNGVINMCFMLLFRDLIRLFASYNDGIINLLEKFFDMNKKQCREAIDIYKKFLIRMDRVAEFLKVAENVGIDKGDIPDLTKAPSSLLDALEQHLSTMEGKKSSTASSTPASQNASNQRNVRTAVTALSSTSSSFGIVATSGRLDANGIDEHLKQQALAEEEAAMNQFKSKVSSPVTTANNPFLNNGSTVSTSANTQSSVDLFAIEPLAALPTVNGRASDDLLQLNPFAEVFIQNNVPPLSPYQSPTNTWGPTGNGFAAQNTQPVIGNGAFVSENSFQSVFGNPENKTADGTVDPSSFNPFLVDDPVPPLLLDSDSPTHTETKPIHHVLSYFQKQNFCETDKNSAEKLPNDKPDEKVSVDEVIHTNSLITQNNTTDNNDTETNANELPDSKKSNPPPRPPPPAQKSKIETIEFLNKVSEQSPLNLFDQCDWTLNEKTKFDDTCDITTPSQSSDNKIPYMFTASEEMSVVTQTIDYDALGGVLQPTSLQGGAKQTSTASNNNQQSGSALLTGDLESSLASLAENLSISSRPAPVKEIQWNSPKNGSKVGSSWTPQPISATTGAGYKPMNQSMPITSQNTMQQPPIFPAMQAMQQPMMGMRPMVANPAMMQQRPGMTTAPTTATTVGQSSLLFH